MVGSRYHIICCLVLMTISGGISGLLDSRDVRDERQVGVFETSSFEQPAERAAKDDFGSASLAGGGAASHQSVASRVARAS